MVLCGFLAALTRRVNLFTAVLVLPLRETIIAAKQAAEVDVLSGGRLTLYGAERAVVRVAFSSRRTLVFRHEALDACRREIELPVSEL